MKKLIIKLDCTENTDAYLTVLDKIDKGVEMIQTCCLEFFDRRIFDKGYSVEIVKKNGDYISLTELYENNPKEYTTREIKEGNNVLKLFLNGDFSFKTGYFEND